MLDLNSQLCYQAGVAPEGMKFGSLRARFELATLRLAGSQGRVYRTVFPS
jgi:hypothetical protein